VVLIPPLLMAPCVLRDHRIRFLTLTGAVVAIGLSVNAWLSPHYVAPFAGALYVILLQSMRHLRQWRPGGQPSGLFLVRAIPVICLAMTAVRLCAEPLQLTVARWPAMHMWYGTDPVGLDRPPESSRNSRAIPEGNSPLCAMAPTTVLSTTGSITRPTSIDRRWFGRVRSQSREHAQAPAILPRS